jgi:pimeloyl-ACP methyl ester carboxylesterase
MKEPYEYTIVGPRGGEITVTVYPSAKGAIIVSCQGFGGLPNGHDNRYLAIAQNLQQQLGTVVRLKLPSDQSLEDYRNTVPDHLRDVLAACGDPKSALGFWRHLPLYLKGVSVGAAASAMVAAEFPVAKMLLVCPVMDQLSVSGIRRGLSSFAGQLYIAAGSEDTYTPPGTANQWHVWAARANPKFLDIIPGCDHHFNGRHAELFRQLPLMAFGI